MRHKIVLLIILVAAVVRFWQLGLVPPSPDWDEAALGYNAYSLLKTGKDEYGSFLPRTLRSFDDYKPPLYAYLTIPSVYFFDLTVWSVRLPSAIAGVLAVIGTYLLTVEVLRRSKAENKKKSYIFSPQIYGQISSLLLALSPWHIQFSRIAFEANTGLTLNIWGIYAFLRGLTSFPWLLASAFIFGVSLYAYHSERIFVPLIVLCMTVIWGKDLFKNKQKVLLAILVGFITVLPLIPVVFDKTSMVRLAGTSALADKTGLLLRSVEKLQDDRSRGDFLGAIFENRRIIYAQKIFEGYSSHFSMRWLFLTGDNDRHHAPDHGLLYLWELPFLLLGMFYVAKIGGRLAAFLFIWFFIAPIAASPTSETPHAIRTLVFLPTFQIFSAFGLMQFWHWLRESIRNRSHAIDRLGLMMLAVIVPLVIFCSILYYLHMYFVHMNVEYSKFWQYGYKEAYDYAQTQKSGVQKIVVSTKLEQPHMFFLFYAKYDPKSYLQSGGTATGGFAETRNAFDVYEFRPIHWHREVHDGTVLYIGTPKEIPTGAQKSINYLNGEEAIRIGK